MKPAALHYAFIAISAFALASCRETQKQETGNNPNAKPGIIIADGALSLPPISGNPGAAYFTIRNATAKTVKIANISIQNVAQTEIHQVTATSMNKLDTVEVAPGSTIKFEPGKMHAMAFGIDPKIQPHATTEMTVTFADGDKVSAPLMAIPIGSNPNVAHTAKGDHASGAMEH